MKIKNVSCTQFAGLYNKNISFTDGINVVYGKNESGKSTIANLISRTLFQSPRIDGRSDKEFRDRYFPAAKKGGSATGDFVDGKLTLESDGREYVLSKEWGADPRCMFLSPNGALRDIDTVQKTLSDLLVYGEGVYSNFVLPSGKLADAALRSLLDSSERSDLKQNLAKAVSLAVAESDGVLVDQIGRQITATIEKIAGKHWDFQKNAPMRKAGRWSKDLGEILKAYYDLEDAVAVLDEINRLELDADTTYAACTRAATALDMAEKAQDSFSEFASSIAVRREREKNIAALKAKCDSLQTDLESWPRLTDSLNLAQTLVTEKQNRDLLDKYMAAKELSNQLKTIVGRLDSTPCPSASELTEAKKITRDISALENKLCSMNIAANIDMLSDSQVIVTSLATGKKLDAKGGILNLTEAVEITVPGVMKLTLSPADININQILNDVTDLKCRLSLIYSKYNADSIEALERISSEVLALSKQKEILSLRLDSILSGTDFDSLRADVQSFTDLRPLHEITADIRDLCADTEISEYIASLRTLITGMQSKYTTVQNLKDLLESAKAELTDAKSGLELIDNIPEDYLGISDPDAHLATLQSACRSARTDYEQALSRKSAASGRLESYKQTLTFDPQVRVRKCTEAFEQCKTLIGNWLDIQNVYTTLKAQIVTNPMQDVADRFEHYLSIISDGGVSSSLSGNDTPDIGIYSRDRVVDYNKLSEGTKETVSLAFRLSLIDHLFPNGGFIILDDPFTDMDSDRISKAGALVTDFAKRHQVIFLTCNSDYLSSLAGNNILI